MLVTPERRRNSKVSAVKSITKGLLTIGDVSGHQGKENIQNRKDIVRNQNDLESLSRDWVMVGDDMYTSMDKFKKEHSL